MKKISLLFLCITMALSATFPAFAEEGEVLEFDTVVEEVSEEELIETADDAEVELMAIASGTCGDNLTWTLDDEGTLIISGTGDMTNWTSNTSTPWYSFRSNVKKVKISDGVTSIGNGAFAGTALESVDIATSVSYIERNAFAFCNNLKSIELPDGITTIKGRSFHGCVSLGVIKIPDSITVIENDAFFDCSNLKTVFYVGNKQQFEDITILDDVLLETKKYYIRDDEYLKGNICEDGIAWVLKCDGELIITGTGAMDDYTPSTIPWKDEIANIKKVTVEDGVTYIGESAFENCTGIVSADIAKSVAGMGDYAFAGCTALESIEMRGVASIGTEVFFGCTNLTEITISNRLTEIADNTFYRCENISTINFWGTEAEFDKIEVGVFNDGFESATVQYINFCGENVYWVLHDDGTLVISGTGEMYNWANEYALPWYSVNSSVKKLIIESGVTSIGKSAFEGCEYLKEVEFSGTVKSIGEYAFYSCGAIEKITISEGVEVIEDSAFGDNEALTAIKFPSSITKIGDCAFQGCSNIKTVEFEEGSKLTYIGFSAFGGGKFSTVKIPASVITISDYAFQRCEELESVIFEEGSKVEVIGDEAFSDCTSLEAVYYPETVGQWNKITIGTGNDALTSANIIFGKVEYNITVTGTTGGAVVKNDSPVTGTFAALQGETISLTAVPDENAEFKAWIDGTTKKILSTKETYNFNVYSNKNIIALFADSSTSDVFVSFVSRNNQYVYYSYIRLGRDINLYVPSPEKMYATGYTFKGYSPELGIVTENTDYTGKYVKDSDKYEIIVINGSDNSGRNQFTASYNALCTVTADEASEGYVFAGWELNGKIVSYDETYKFYSFDDAYLEATYAKSVDVAPLVELVDITKSKNGEYDIASILGTAYVPEGLKFIESGLIYVKTNTEEESLVLENEGTKINGKEVKRTTSYDARKMFKLTASYPEEGISVRGYLVYLDENGNRKVIYTDAELIKYEKEDNGIDEDIDMN